MHRLLPASALVLLLASPAFAETPPPAAASTVLHLTQSAERRIARDLLHVEMRAVETGTDPQTIQAAINQTMAKALAAARQVQDIEIETGSYGLYRETPQKTPLEWTGSQELFLSGADSGSLLKLAGVLQAKGLVMANLGYEVSPKVVHAAEDDLTAEALSALQQRAEAIARQLHLAVLGYRNLTVGNAETGGGPMPRFAAATPAPLPPPVAAPGEATVRVTVSADILLKSP
jgi:predicted secreted protein